jgi:hypothetical protein
MYWLQLLCRNGPQTISNVKKRWEIGFIARQGEKRVFYFKIKQGHNF